MSSSRPHLSSHLSTTVGMLFDNGAIRVEPRAAKNPTMGFKLAFHTEVDANAPLAPCYVSLRTKGHKDGTLTPELVQHIAKAMDTVVLRTFEQSLTSVCGIPDAGTPFGTVLAEMLCRPHLGLEKQVIDGRRQFRFTGARPQKGDLTLVCDDLISDAVVKEMVLKLITKSGSEAALVVFLDRRQGGLELLRNRGYLVEAALTLTELFDEGVRLGKLSPKLRDLCLAYPKTLRDWKTAHGYT